MDSICFTICAVLITLVLTLLGMMFGIDTRGFMRESLKQQAGMSPSASYQPSMPSPTMQEFDKEMEVFVAHATTVNQLIPAYRAKADRVQIKLMTAQANDLADENVDIAGKCQNVTSDTRIRKCLNMLRKFNAKAQSFINFLQR
ncbi:MAG: hypothetical protein OYH77_05045 [Pseudomonadota bacterium]|nr:hypothetical protein [Pseudomonadota bacterium]